MKFMLFLLQCYAFQERPLAIPNEKLCKNCKFFKKKLFDENKFGHCTRFPFQATNNYFLVDGVKDTSPTSYHYCSTARSFDHMCGPEGKYYE